MIASVIHLDAGALPGPRLAELCSGAALLACRLQQQGVQATLLLQCSAAADAAACFAAAQSAAPGPAAATPLVVAQPGQVPVSLRLALERTAAAPSDIVFVSVSDSSAAASQAAALGCAAVEHLPARAATPAQVQAWGLQAVACHAARRHAPPPLMVGYVMKESRQLALSAQGMLPLLAPPPAAAPAGAPGGPSSPSSAAAAAPAAGARAMCFMPLDLGSILSHQLRRCHIVLQKLTDCLQPGGGGGGGGGGSSAVAPFTPEAAALLAALDQQQQPPQQQQHGASPAAAAGEGNAGAGAVAAAVPVCLVDPATTLQPIMDRAELVRHLQATALAVRQQAIPMRAPASLLLRAYDPAATPRQLAAAGVALPCILKPQAACGVAEAHQMAFILHGSGFAELEVPLPALAQEYVDHGGTVWKVYVAGRQVFWTQRKSTPDLAPLAAQLAADADADIPASIGFDSLKSLPTTLPWLRHTQKPQAPAQHEQQQAQQAQAEADGVAAGSGGGSVAGRELMRQPTFEAVAAALRQRLGLTLFGFDLVFDRAAGELVIVDVNYFPSFKGIPEAPAALQGALWERYAAHLAAAAAAKQ